MILGSIGRPVSLRQAAPADAPFHDWSPSMTPGALDGIRVIDATNFVFGPVATQMLGDMGADVIKIEPPEGDPTRRIGAMRSPLMGSLFLNLNRNKRSVVLDLKRPAELSTLRALIGGADVFVHNMRQGAIARLGLGFDALRTDHPGLVYAAAQGFGEGGRYFDRPAYDDVIQGLGGIAGLNERMTSSPGYVPMLMTDKLCGVYLAFAVATALVHRERTGRGQEVRVPMFETVAAFTLHEHLADAVFDPGPGAAPAPLGYQRVFGRMHRPLATRDGAISVIANTDTQWQRLFEVIGRAALRHDARFATMADRIANADALYVLVEDALSTRTSAQWIEALTAADIPAGPVNDLQSLRDDPHLADVGFFVRKTHETAGPLLYPGVPFAFGDSPGSIRRGPPGLGEHTAQVLGAIGGGSAAPASA
jgi:crotonobetainyl-CoA:carnitine CoA-transferase CaiB-like acyl-CoA transferase